MLPRPHKLSASSDFKETIRKGARAGSSALVVHVQRRDELVTHGGPRFGLVVSKQVGNAVTRHAVSRKLRTIALEHGVETLDAQWNVVIRAMPPAAEASSAELAKQFVSALQRAVAKAEKH